MSMYMYKHKDLMEADCGGTEFYIITETKGVDWIIHIICKKCGGEVKNIFGIFEERPEKGLIKIEPKDEVEEIFCPICNGEGVTHKTEKDSTSATSISVTCWKCMGRGKVKK